MEFIKYMNSLRNVRTEEINAIANITESSTSSVYLWMAGKVNVPRLKKKIIAEYLGKPIEELWPDEKEE